MDHFFGRVSYEGVSEFSIYTFPHIAALLLSVVALLGLYYYAPSLKNKPHERTIRYAIGIVMLLSNVSIYIYVYRQGLPWYEYLPEATCGLAIYFGAISLITKNRTLAVLTFFWGWGAISTFLAPNLMEGPSRYNFYQFFIRHFLILASTVYLFRIHDLKIYKKDFKIYIGYTLPMVLIGGLVSFLVNKPNEFNMFYVMQPAKNTPVFDIIHEWSFPVYVIVWLLFAILIGYIYAIPFYQKERVKEND